MAPITAAESCDPSAAHRTDALCESRFTVALRTPGTLWMASVTCRAQLPHVMPDTESSVVAEFCGEFGFFSDTASIVLAQNRAEPELRLMSYQRRSDRRQDIPDLS